MAFSSGGSGLRKDGGITLDKLVGVVGAVESCTIGLWITGVEAAFEPPSSSAGGGGKWPRVNTVVLKGKIPCYVGK